MLLALLRLKLKQTIWGDGLRGILKFLAPDFLVGLFLALSAGGFDEIHFPDRVALVATGVALFTLIAETRKLFFSGGDVEDFYFVRPTLSYRISSALVILVIGALVLLSIFLPVIFFSASGQALMGKIGLAFLTSLCISISVFFFVLFVVSWFSPKVSNPLLTFLQLAMALLLLAVFQLSSGVDLPFGSGSPFVVSAAVLFIAFFLFGAFPFAERLSSRLNVKDSSSRHDMASLVSGIRRLLMFRSSEEEAGFMFYATTLLRNPSFRLSTVGVAATPVMVALYWSMQGARFMYFHMYPGLVSSDFVAPLISLVVSAVLVHYFLSQNVLSSVDHEAAWLVRTAGDFNVGRFVLGIRKALLVTVQIPMTALVFFVLAFENPISVTVASVVTFYLLSHVAVSWFSVMQKDLPFSLPFTRIGAIEAVNLVFMVLYSMLVSVILYFSYGQPEKLLMVNILAFILIGLLEFFSTRIVNKRVKLSV